MRERISRWLVCFSLACSAVSAAPVVREAPNGSAAPANQLVVAGNACGPTALLNAFRFGNEHWQRASDAVLGDNDKQRILRIIREIGMRPSKHVPGHPRWSRRGVSVADLRDMGNEMTMGKYLPQLSEDVFFLKTREKPEKLLRRIHQRLETSMEKGFPPVLSLRRYALRKGGGKSRQWMVVDAHFVTITSIPRKLERRARSFAVGYIDPWGGKRCEGRIAIPEPPKFTNGAGAAACLGAQFPKSRVGMKLLRKGEDSLLVPAAAIGRW